jgi:arginine-tRNA-protein transferase
MTRLIKKKKIQHRDFIVQSNVDSLCISFFSGDQLKMVSVVDIVEDGVSAVYTFYDTSDNKASFGTYSVLWLIEWSNSFICLISSWDIGFKTAPKWPTKETSCRKKR